MNSNRRETISIPIETKVREFDGKLWLGLNAVERGYKVAIGPAFEINRTLDITKPDFHITKDPGDGKIGFFKKLHAAGITVCGLDTEGAVFESIDQFATNKTEFLNHIDAFCAWGEKPADVIRNNFTETDKVHVTGNPRFDLLHPHLRYIYRDRASSLNDQYGQYILLNCNFSIANPYSQNQIDKIEEVVGTLGQGRRNFAHRILHLFFESIYHLNSELPDIDIVVRPHPSEKNDTYKVAFDEYGHIHVEDSGDARDWIAGASVVLHHDCTTGIESAMMGTPVVSYRPIQSEKYESRLPQIVSHEALSREELAKYIGRSPESDKPYEMDKGQKSELKQYFHNVDESAAELICDVIESLDTVNERNYEILEHSLADSLKRRVKTSGFADHAIAVYDSFHNALGNESIPKQRQYQRQKFPGLKKREIIDSIQQMKPLLDIDAVSVEEVPKTNNSFFIRPE